MRVFPFKILEITIMIEELFGHKNPNDEEPLADKLASPRR